MLTEIQKQKLLFGSTANACVYRAISESPLPLNLGEVIEKSGMPYRNVHQALHQLRKMEAIEKEGKRRKQLYKIKMLKSNN